MDTFPTDERLALAVALDELPATLDAADGYVDEQDAYLDALRIASEALGWCQRYERLLNG